MKFEKNTGKKSIMLQNFMEWADREFGYPIPQEYLSFLEKGELEPPGGKYYATDNGNVLEISEWFTPDNIPAIFKNCREEKMIEAYQLPVLESCGCTVVLSCNSDKYTYGHVLLRTSTGYYDESINENIYEEPEYVAESFTAVIRNLKDAEELEEMGLL
mgnify:FL=1